MDNTKKPTICKSCQQNIFFIETKNGKFMPVDAQMFVAQEDDSRRIIILTDGTTKRGVLRGDTGYIPHWSTCHNAGAFRK